MISGRAIRTISLCFWLALPSLAEPDVRWVGTPRDSFCAGVLEKLGEAVMGGRPVMQAGPFSAHPEILARAGVEPSRIDVIIEFERRVLQSQDNDPLLREVLDSVSVLLNDDRHVFCLVPLACAIAGRSEAVNVVDRTQFYPVDDLAHVELSALRGMVDSRPDIAPKASEPSKMATILRAGAGVSEEDYLRFEFHELTHVSFERLLERWIQANLILSRRGEPMDPSFVKYVKVVPSVPPVSFIDKGYYEVLGEARSELVEEIAQRIAMGMPAGTPVAGLAVFDRIVGWNYPRMGFVQEAGIDESNLYSFARTETARMREFITRAGLRFP